MELDPRVFDTILNDMYISHSIDLFALRLNLQIQKCVAWKPDPDAMCSNAFSLNYGDISIYLFPQLCLISRCVRKIITGKARSVMIAPLWPIQCWLTHLMHILI